DANDAANTLTFTCELTGPTPTSQFDCNSGTAQFNNLTDDSYTLSMFATHTPGNAGPTHATWTFTVGVAPDTIIDSAIDGANTNNANAATIHTISLHDALPISDANDAANTLTFTCELTGPTPTSQFDCNSGTAQF